MKITLLCILLAANTAYIKASDQRLYNTMADAICSCLSDNDASAKAEYKTCVTTKLKPFRKEIKKEIRQMSKSISKEEEDGFSTIDALDDFFKNLEKSLKQKCNDSAKEFMDIINSSME